MKKAALLYFSCVFLLPAVVFYSCTKTSSNINDGQVIATPYSLYFTDVNGALFNTNDGKTSTAVFSSDGAQSRSIVTYGKNILWAMDNVYVSANNGINFNSSYDAPNVAMDGFINVNGKACGLNQTMMISIPSWNDAYVASRAITALNYFGMAESYQGGLFNTWNPEDLYDTVEVTNPTAPVTVTSFTFLANSTLLAYGASTQTTMVRAGSPTTRWIKMYDTAGAGAIPVNDAQAWYSLGHINNRAILIDNMGSAAAYGGSPAYYSDDNGLHWKPLAGLPTNTPIMCIASPWEQLCLVGTDGQGLYLLNANTNTFQPNNNGLPGNLTVRNIAFKENVYKNGTVQQYVYLATNQGLYQSADMGIDWVLTIPGNFVNVY